MSLLLPKDNAPVSVVRLRLTTTPSSASTLSALKMEALLINVTLPVASIDNVPATLSLLVALMLSTLTSPAVVRFRPVDVMF